LIFNSKQGIFMRFLLSWLLIALLAACAPVTKNTKIDINASEREKAIQKELALQQMLKRDVRANNVGLSILTANTAECGDKLGANIGAAIVSNNKMDKEWHEPAKKLWGVTDKATVVAFYKNSAAEAAGLKVGDQITKVNNKSLKDDLLQNPMKAIAKPYKTPASIAFNVLRNNIEEIIHITPAVACDYPIEVIAQDEVNAFADGNAIYLTNGMLRFAETDDELAVVIGHELAHNTMGHMKKKQGNQLLGTILGVLATVATGVDFTNLGAGMGATMYSQEFESEADYVGMYSTAKAGYAIENTPNFWRRMGVEHPSGISHGQTHPNTANRFLALEKTVKEIGEKRANNQPLKYELKNANPTTDGVKAEPPAPAENKPAETIKTLDETLDGATTP
jgi:beta-barrel assembly-enhancing protease